MYRTIAVTLLVVSALACQTTRGPEEAAGNGSASDSSNFPSAGEVGNAGDSSLTTVYFDYDQATLRPEAKSVLTENADWLKQNPDKRIEIQGHCDERGSTEYNLALGMRRAQAAKQYLVDLGVEQSRLRATSFGEERPAVRGEGEMAWSKNRRGDFVPK